MHLLVIIIIYECKKRLSLFEVTQNFHTEFNNLETLEKKVSLLFSFSHGKCQIHWVVKIPEFGLLSSKEPSAHKLFTLESKRRKKKLILTKPWNNGVKKSKEFGLIFDSCICEIFNYSNLFQWFFCSILLGYFKPVGINWRKYLKNWKMNGIILFHWYFQ